MDVTDFALTNVRKNCYTFIQNGNEVLPRFLIETAKRLMTSVHGTGVSAFFATGTLIQGKNKLEKQGGKKKTG